MVRAAKHVKPIALTKVKKTKNLDKKQEFLTKFESKFEAYNNIFFISISNHNANDTKHFRKLFEHSGIFFCAKKTLMKRGLLDHFGEEKQDVVERMIGETRNDQCGILLTNDDKSKVEEAIKKFGSENFLKTGSVAPHTVEITDADLKHFPSSIQPYLIKIGMHINVDQGVIKLVNDSFRICEKGQEITSDQSKMLRCLGMKISQSAMNLCGSFNAQTLEAI